MPKPLIHRMALLAAWVATSASLSAQSLPEGVDKAIFDKVDAASLEYPAQYAGMKIFLAVVKGETEVNSEAGGNFSDFRYVYAYRAGKTRKQDCERVELIETLNFPSRNPESINRFEMTAEGHHWIGTRDYAVDRFGSDDPLLKPQLAIWDPFSMPLNSYACRLVRDENSYRDIASYTMIPGKMFHAEIDAIDRRVGRWRAGLPEELGYDEIVFDPKFGNMPVEMRTRVLRPGFTTVDPSDPIKCTRAYQRTQSKWFKHPSGNYLPSEVRCVETNADEISGWTIHIEWWLDDEVPDEVFTIEDLLKAHLNASVVNALELAREQQKVAAERRNSEANTK
jgi:hypothetical protein